MNERDEPMKPLNWHEINHRLDIMRRCLEQSAKFDRDSIQHRFWHRLAANQVAKLPPEVTRVYIY